MKNTIFIIEDDNVTRMVLRKALLKENYDVYDFESGKSALLILEKLIPDILITDVYMPEMDGLEVVKHFKKSAPDCKIIAISSYGKDSSFDILEVTIDHGAHLSFSKPLYMPDIFRSIKVLLSQ